MFLNLFAGFIFFCFEDCLCIVFIITTKRKHNKVTLKTEYEALKVFNKNRPNKEVVIQFSVSRSTLSTWNQPILPMFVE